MLLHSKIQALVFKIWIRIQERKVPDTPLLPTFIIMFPGSEKQQNQAMQENQSKSQFSTLT